MPISEAYRRGYRRAVADAAQIAIGRSAICADAAQRYEKEQKNPQAAATERCARREAEHIWEQILKLKPVQDRE